MQIRPLLGEILHTLPVGWLPESEQPQHLAVAAAQETEAWGDDAAHEAEEEFEDDGKRPYEDQDEPNGDEPDAKRAAVEGAPSAKEAGPSRDVFVSNIAFEATLKDVRELFKSAGSIADVRMPKPADGRTYAPQLHINLP